MKQLAILAALALLIVPPWDAFAAEPKAKKPADGLLSKGPLAKYVAKPDKSYGWVKRSSGKIADTKYVELTLTSQTWRNIPWKHQLFVINPKKAKADNSHALLFIAGGRWRAELEKPPMGRKIPREAAVLAAIAEQLGTPVAILLQVPQQPIFGGKVEDQIIAFTFEKFLRTGDTDWPLLLPMVKSAVRGMDATSELASSEWKMKLKTFTVTGASKRGWTTWLTGAVDRRAIAIAPMVIDMLNMAPQMKHQLAAWGDYSHMIHDYTERGLQEHLASKGGKALRAIVDPYSYRKVLTQPKLIMLGTNDPYWPLDALNLYWDGLSGQKHVLYVPNNGHGLSDLVRVAGSLAALHHHAANGTSMPKLAWKLAQANGKLSLRVTSDVKPVRVRAWVAKSATRDFRESRWISYATTKAGEAHVHDLAIPSSGYAALFGEAVYGGLTVPYYLSTNVRIVGAERKAAGGK